MNKVAAQILGFFFAVVGLFVLISQLIPQVSSHPQKALSPEEFAQMTTEQLLAKGQEVFGTSGIRCSQCHQIEGAPGRGPNLGGIGAKAASRAQERAAATGRKFTPEEYLLESLVKPEAYLVKGYSAIMPQVYKSPMNLSEEDIKAVVAYLESLGGQVTVSSKTRLPEDWRAEIAAAKKAAAEPVTGDLANGKRLFYDKLRCLACHQTTTADGKAIGGVLGPDLSRVGEIRGPESLKTIITNPPGDIMPKHYRENLSEQELNDLVVFLQNLRGT